MTILTLFSNAKLVATQLDDMTHKLKMCSDSNVRSVAEELMSSLNGATSFKAQKTINKVEHLLDTVNTANGEYCPLYNEWIPNKIIKKTSWIEKFIVPKRILDGAKKQTYSAPRAVRQHSHQPGFSNIEKFSSLKRYISRYSDDKEMIDYLYKNYYLKSIDDRDFVSFLEKIDKEFGVKLFSDMPLKKSSQLYIYEELNNFKKASMGKEKFPPIIDITDFDPMVNLMRANGICVKTPLLEFTQWGARVATEDFFMKKYQGLRHELIHWFDKKLDITKLSERRAKIKPEEIAEMKNASVRNLPYAYNCDNDFKAVWGQGSMSKYSEKIKQKMIKKGIPKWVTTLDDVSLKKYLDDIYTDEKSKKILDEIKANFKGDLPEELIYQLIDNPEKLQTYNNLLKYKDHNGEPMFLLDLYSYADLPKERLDFVEKFSKLSVKAPVSEEMKAEGLIDDFRTVSMESLGYRIKDFSVEQLEKIYEKAKKCETVADYDNLQSLLGRYLDMKSHKKLKKSTSSVKIDINKIKKACIEGNTVNIEL